MINNKNELIKNDIIKSIENWFDNNLKRYLFGSDHESSQFIYKDNNDKKILDQDQINNIKNIGEQFGLNKDDYINQEKLNDLRSKIYSTMLGELEPFVYVNRPISFSNSDVSTILINIQYSSIDVINKRKHVYSTNLKIEVDEETLKYVLPSEINWFEKFHDLENEDNINKSKIDYEKTNDYVKNILKRTNKNKSLVMNSSKMKKHFSNENYIISRFIDELVLDNYFMKFNDDIDTIVIEHNTLVPFGDILSKLNSKFYNLNRYKVQPLNLYLKKDGTLILELQNLWTVNFNEKFIYYICQIDTTEIDPLKHHLKLIAGITSNFKPKLNTTAIKMKDNKVTIDFYDLINLISSNSKKIINYEKLEIVEK